MYAFLKGILYVQWQCIFLYELQNIINSTLKCTCLKTYFINDIISFCLFIHLYNLSYVKLCTNYLENMIAKSAFPNESRQ